MSEPKLLHKRYEIEQEQKWREEISAIPAIRFHADWLVQIIPPFGDAVIRFRVKLPSGKEKSIYLDRRNSLGYWEKPDEPYWEVYPYQSDVGRCGINEVETLLEMIGNEEE
jgi:hypothetical protein